MPLCGRAEHGYYLLLIVWKEKYLSSSKLMCVCHPAHWEPALQCPGAGPAAGCPLPTQVPMPMRPQGWWGRNPLAGTGMTGQLISLIRSTSILTSLCPSTALNPSRSSGNDIMGGGKQLTTSARLAVTEQGNSFCIPLSLLSNSLNNWISPHRTILTRYSFYLSLPHHSLSAESSRLLPNTDY